MALVGRHFIRDDRLDTVHEIPAGSVPYLLAVADGLGGHSAGEVASREVLEALKGRVGDFDRGLDPPRLADSLSHAASEIHGELTARGAHNPRHRGMSTTLTAVLLYEEQLFLLHAGDSRCYVMKNGVLRKLTRDHTLREFSGDPRIPGNILVNCFGVQDDFFADTRQLGSEGQAGDVFLLCSDGLTDMVPDERLEVTIREADTLSAAGERLLTLSHEAGGADNITFVLARVL
jgi:protein phosphatase